MDDQITKTKPSCEKLLLFWNSVRRIVTDLDVEDSKLTEDHANRLRRHYNQLLCNLSVPDVVAQMFQSGKLTVKELEHIRQFLSTPIKASEELLNIVISNSRDVYECLLESLKRTKQHHVYQMLTSDEGSFCIGEQSMTEHSRLIRQNYVWLTENLDPDSGLMTTLYAREVLSQREYGQVAFEKDPFVKKETLLSIIGRKSVEEFRKFKVALNATSQGHISNRLTETTVGVADQNVTTTVNKTFPTGYSGSLGRRNPPKFLPKNPPNKSLVNKPLLEPKIIPSKPNRTEKRSDFTKQEILKKQSFEYMETKYLELPTDWQTDVSTKIVQLHQKKSTVSIWSVSFMRILEESRNIRTHGIMQARAVEENYKRQMQEIIQRERECRIIIEDIQRENFSNKEKLKELQETARVLDERHRLTEDNNICLSSKLKKSEEQAEELLKLNKQMKQDIHEKVSVIEKLNGRVMCSEIKVQKMDVQFRDTRDKLVEKDLILKENKTKLDETEYKLDETKAKITELETNLMVTENCIKDLIMRNERKEEEVFEKLSIVTSLQSQIIQSEVKFEQVKTKLSNTERKVKTTESDLKASTINLRETQEKLKEAETRIKEFEEKLAVAEKDFESKLLDLKHICDEERIVWAKERKELTKLAQEHQQESSGNREKCLNIEKQLQLERSQKDRLKEVTAEYKRIIDGFRDEFKLDPVLVKTIRTNEEKKAISGLTILDKYLFVTSRLSPEVEVYDSNILSVCRRWVLKELIDPFDLGSCSRNKCLYIFDCKRFEKSKEILRVDINGKLIRSWSTGDDWGFGLSVTDEANIILTVCNRNELHEYSPDGQLIRKVNLSLSAGICNSFNASKLTNGHFVVSHGYDDHDELHRVCIVDAYGKLKKSFGGRPGSAVGQMHYPVDLSVNGNGFVLVADRLNQRVLLLDSDLEFKREILSKEKHGLRRPSRIVLDKSNGRMFVADNVSNNHRILVFDFEPYYGKAGYD